MYTLVNVNGDDFHLEFKNCMVNVSLFQQPNLGFVFFFCMHNNIHNNIQNMLSRQMHPVNTKELTYLIESCWILLLIMPK